MKYKVFNPSDGLYTTVETLDECLKLVSERAYNLYMSHTHQQPYSIVELTSEGHEVWNNTTIDEEQIKKHLVEQFAK
jgi:hypothetical protein